MPDNQSLSFTATLLVNGYPLTILGEATEGAINVRHPDPSLETIDVTQALGVLTTPDEAWNDAREAAHVDFHLTGDVMPTLFYFRHTDEGYRLYIRGGAHAGQGVFKSKYGVATVSPIEDVDPTPWQIRYSHNNQPVTLADMEIDFSVICLECSASAKTLATELIAEGEGAYLITHRSRPATSLRLNIQERGVDWARG
ncbi:hypothetical protein [Pseudomonas sp. KU43P]|uniref:hypothetical protein n=1 Tax=Pseudomonas sp. KU43P TaxID=2487887 RepID=UPI0012AAB806|nr:hypothetical protein [Pseudomonas sp. KU43P]BBH44232.1 hypothetical protein KU43P_07090 [Pseudomonas sp. KU43P]